MCEGDEECVGLGVGVDRCVVVDFVDVGVL